MENRITGPPAIAVAGRVGRDSHLPPKRMSRVYRSEMARRTAIANDEANWRRLELETAEMQRSDAALDEWAAAFAACLCPETLADPAVDAADGFHIKREMHYGNGTTRGN